MDQAVTVARHETAAHAGDFAPQVLIPFHHREAVSLPKAAITAAKSERTVRNWCGAHDLGRRIGGHWAVSRVALAMYLDGNEPALRSYLMGARQFPLVADYYRRLGLADLLSLPAFAE
jgi:hypothetical protein